MKDITESLYLGIDLGSVSVKTVVLDQEYTIRKKIYSRHHGHPGKTLIGMLEEMLQDDDWENILRIGVTGSGGKRIAEIFDAPFTNEVIAEATAVSALYPEVQSIINIGGQDSKLILLEKNEYKESFILDDFSMNTLCAAGTGAFLEQQAGRLGVSIEKEFGALAIKSECPPRIAGRCSVFAKSDMIHLQQKATPEHDILAGLCYAVARNFKATIGKNVEISEKVAFIGGVARNEGMVKAFRDVLALRNGGMIIPDDNALIGAIGAAISVVGKDGGYNKYTDIKQKITSYSTVERGYGPLKLRPAHREKPAAVNFSPPETGTITGFLGVDVGSISTNVVVIDSEGKLLSKQYLRTGSNPIEAVKSGIALAGDELAGIVSIEGACVTGSGRYLVGDFLGADIVKNEITAHARGAREYCSDVDTIFEIGGQDSKYISLRDGAITDFEMNKVCAAGTGSFLEEQAERLEVDIREEFSDLALAAENPSRCGERCTVFMESDLVHHQQRGAGKEDIVAGLCYSIVHNYLNKVVEDRHIGKKILFQGGVAFNKGVVAAFEQVLGKEIEVPPHHEVLGALGCALIAREGRQGRGEVTWEKSSFRGFGLQNREYEVHSFECSGCSNMCTVNRVTIEGEGRFFYGSRCDRYDKKDKVAESEKPPDYFAEREKLFFIENDVISVEENAPTVGIPLSMIMYENLPLWKTFFNHLGVNVRLSDSTHRWHINAGLETVVEETCFPIKVLHGHISELFKEGVDFLFLPRFLEIDNQGASEKESFLCPYVQAAPDVVKTAFTFGGDSPALLDPVIRYIFGEKSLETELHQKIGLPLGKTKKKIVQALQAGMKSHTRFLSDVREAGNRFLDELSPDELGIVIISRPYNGCDRGINLDIPGKLRELGVKAIPMDFLPLEIEDITDELPNMTWWYGQRILNAARIICKYDNLYPVYITNFACGPDSFILQYFRYLMNGKPFLQIEIDEHSADAGIITRAEAFIDSLKQVRHKAPERKRIPRLIKSDMSRRTLYIPPMGDVAYSLKAAFIANGVKADVLPMADDETLEWGRKYTTGKECYPHIVTVGDVVKFTKQPDFDPDTTAFFMPASSSVCRLNHYSTWQRIVLDDLGLEKVPVFSPDADNNMFDELEDLGISFMIDAWKGFVAVDTLTKAWRETAPYELKAGDSRALYKKGLDMVCDAIREKKDLLKVMREIRTGFDGIAADRSVRKPIIGIVGEAFVRNHGFSNGFIADSIESLGGEVWSVTIGELFMFFNAIIMTTYRGVKDYGSFLKTFIQDRLQVFYDHRISGAFKGYLRNYPEPSIKELFDLARPYFDPIAETETPLSIGRSITFIRKGMNGIVNVIPFTCMPGTIAASLFKRLKEENRKVAFLTLKFDGMSDMNLTTRLEAFMHQAAQYADLSRK
jgi:predicted CoA-substrate-specific enzyme activase